VTPPADSRLELPRNPHPIAHPDRSRKLKIAAAPLLLPLSRSRVSELEEPFDPLQCEIFLLPLPSHEGAPFLKYAGQF
jgi:hypothetical protein